MTKEIICEVETEQAQSLEEELIKAHNSVRKGYNDTYVGGGGDIWEGRRDTKEYMEWISHMKEISTGKNDTRHMYKAKCKKGKCAKPYTSASQAAGFRATASSHNILATASKRKEGNAVRHRLLLGSGGETTTGLPCNSNH